MGDAKRACGREGLNWNFKIWVGVQQEAMERKGGYCRRRNEHEQGHRAWKMLGAVTMISGHTYDVHKSGYGKGRATQLETSQLGQNLGY